MLQTIIKSYLTKGYAVLPNFIPKQQCQDMITQIQKLVDGWNPTPDEISVYATAHDDYKKQDYYLGSADKVRFFLENGGYKDGKFLVDKKYAVSKIGHNLHELVQPFRNISYKKVIKEICNGVGIQNPVTVQSMAIFKPPGLNQKVVIHQDSSYGYDEPRSAMGFWVPFEDTTLENGCLWALPGSHKRPLYCRQFFDHKKRESKLEVYKEKDYTDEEFEPIPMKKGDLIFFHGLLFHKSEINRTNRHRYSYVWHLKDRDSKWSPHNWLQRNFPELPYDR